MTAFQPSERLRIDGPGGPLEALVTEADGGERAHAVICHPHPLYGGTMDNKVVTTLARALQECGIPTVRFNFRGVGASGGTYDEGKGETADAAAVADWAALRWPQTGLVLAGFSFGAYVATRLAALRAVKHLITVAPPVQRFDFGAVAKPSCPWLLVQGDADELVDAQEVLAWADAPKASLRVVMMPGVGHFFHGHLTELRDAVVQEIRSG
jgi:alpha/beta superfamily hydrolase